MLTKTKPKTRLLMLLLAFILVAGTFSTSISSATVTNGASGTASNSLLGAGYNGVKYNSSHYSSGLAVKFGIKSGSKTYIGYCLNASLKMNTGTAYTAKNAAGASMYKKLNDASQEWLPILMVYGYHPGKASPVAKTNVNDYYFATQVITWEFTSGYRTSPTKRTSDKEYNNLKGKPAERCYNWILKEMANHVKGASFTRSTKASAKTYPMTYNYKTKKWSVTLTDTNKVNYLKKLAASTSGLTISRNGYKYTFSATKAGTFTAAMANSGLGNYDGSENQPLLVWQAKSATSSNQAVSVGATDETEFYVKFTTEKPGTAKIIKTSDNDVVQGFQFLLTNSSNGYSVIHITDKDGLITANLYPGTYKVQELLTKEQKEQGYTEAKATTLTVKAGETATVKVHNQFEPNHATLRVIKDTSDGGSVEGFQFKVEGIQADSKILTEEELVKLADPSVTGLEDYEVSDWTVDKEQLANLNQAAKEGKTGIYPVNLRSTAKLKETSEQPEALDASENPDTISLSAKVKINLQPLKGAAHTEQMTDNNVTWQDFSWNGSATLFEKMLTTNIFGFAEIAEMEVGTYTVTEVMTKEQTLRYHEPKPQTVTISEDDPDASVSVFFENKARNASVRIVKTCVDGQIENVEFTITGTTAWGEEIEPIVGYTDEDGYLLIEDLAAGTYTITESNLDTEAYVPQGSKTITITGDEEKPVEAAFELEVGFENIPYTDVEISKQSETTGEELPGATLQIIDKETGEVVEEWTSGEEPHKVTGLEYGKEYILHEDLAPIGYACAQDITFTAGGTEKVTMVDEVTKLYITKIDKTTGQYLPGASFDILDADTHKVVASFTTPETRDKDLIYVEVTGLTEGADYIIRETEAPKGYTIAEDQTITFKNKMKVAIADTAEGTVIITGDDNINGAVQTGDTFNALPFIILAGVALMVAADMIINRRKRGAM